MKSLGFCCEGCMLKIFTNHKIEFHNNFHKKTKNPDFLKDVLNTPSYCDKCIDHTLPVPRKCRHCCTI